MTEQTTVWPLGCKRAGGCECGTPRTDCAAAVPVNGQPQGEAGWRPISEAPKKGRVLAWRPAYKSVCEVYVDDFDPCRVVEPITGKTWITEWWMPLPSPPPGQKVRRG